MRNVLCGAFSNTAPGPYSTLAEVITPRDLYPPSRLAVYIRGLSECCTQERTKSLVGTIALIRDKRSISLRIHALPPMSI